jgi:adenosine deaminase
MTADRKNIRDLIARLPKAELHLHLEGSITPRTWLQILRRHEPATTLTEAGLAQRMRFHGMAGFFDLWMQMLYTMHAPEDYRLAAYACGMDLARQNVRYVELHTSIAGAQWSGRHRADEVMPAIADGLAAAHREGGPEWRLIVDIIRELVAEGAGEIGLEIARRHRAMGVVAVGLGGNEAQHATDAARGLLAAARAEGLHATVHAGEAAGPESIRAALACGAERIGHAARATEDPTLVEELAAGAVPLEMCPTSNVLTGAVRSLEEHPIGPFLRRGMNVSLNTDDPPLFGTDLEAEFMAVARVFRLTPPEIVRLARNGFAGAFLPDAEKAALLAAFDALHPAPNGPLASSDGNSLE